MSYFKQITDYQTYRGDEYDFHLDYNANSGGGQAFLGGSYAGGDGGAHASRELEGKNASFVFSFIDPNGEKHTVQLGTQEEYRYPISPRGTGSQQMKLGMSGGKVRPSLLLPAVMMLPETTTINMANSLDVSPLTTGNYWLRSMWLECETDAGGEAHFIPKDYVFSGGLSKQNGYATDDGKPTGSVMYFKLDYSKRANDILYAADNCASLSQPVTEILHYFRDVLNGEIAFDHQDCYSRTAELMRLMAHEHPTTYSGIGDPLPTIMEVVGKPLFVDEPERSVPSKVPEPHNLIFFGAPGTGKSYQLARLAERYFAGDAVRRVTFHPDYTYAQFVGCYKPTEVEQAVKTDTGEETVERVITYDFVPGPFLETYVAAVQNPDTNYLLIVEEINRANPAATFGDIFQLLDRDDDGRSEYEMAVPVEMRRYLEVRILKYKLNGRADSPQQYLSEESRLNKETKRLSLPPKMYIWATMNSADQGVFPMDTAFKRRWDFRYMGIDDGSSVVESYAVPVGTPPRMVSWDALRRGINRVLLDAGVNEDKLLGPFFISPSRLRDTANFTQTFVDKVLLYLFEDAAKTKKSKVFSHDGNATYSEICEDFKTLGEGAFRGMKKLDSVTDVQGPEAKELDGIGTEE